jgi:hypothetical protein
MPVQALRQVALAAMIFSSAALAACRADAPADQGNAPQTANVAAPVAAPKLVPAPEPRLDREALLIAAVRARSAAASGSDDAAAQGELDGKRFEFRIRLGCSLGAEQAAGDAIYEEAKRRVELKAAPDLSLEQPIVAALAGEGVEAVEGFWVPRPWLLAPSCAGADPAQAAAPEQPAVAIAQYFTQADARTGRRDGRPYEARQNVAEGEVPAAGSWDLVLTGRLRKVGDRVIACRAEAAGQMPVCIVSAAFEEVSIVNVATGEVLAHWGRG